MMLKTTYASSQFNGEPTMQRIPVLTDGRIGPNDRAVLIKRAGAQFVHDLRDIKLGIGEIPVHTIALGATEDYGPNRNGDGFKRAACERKHETFVKLGMFYRNHQNKDKKKSYGRIVKSAWHAPMKRIELLIGLNGTEKAAKANGGLLADKEIEKLDKGDDIPTSMACKVAYDICSGCGNKARHRGEYCNADNCSHGGLVEKIGMVVDDDGHVLHADNPDPNWFDESHVYKPADRIAWSLGILEKDAADEGGRVVSGAELAERIGLVFPAAHAFDPSAPKRVGQQLKLAQVLAAEEEVVRAERPGEPSALWKSAFAGREPIQEIPDAQTSPGRLGDILHALASEKVALPVRDWLALMLGSTQDADACADDVARQLPGVFGRLTKQANLRELIEASPYNPSTGMPSVKIRNWATKLAVSHSLDEHLARRRVEDAGLFDVKHRVRKFDAEIIKEAADGGGAEMMAREYGLYCLAFLGAVEDREGGQNPLTATLLVQQNYVA